MFRRAVAVLIALAAGAALALLAMPWLVSHARNDSSRLCDIVRNASSLGGIVAVLGNSTGILGIDAPLLGGDARNFCTSEQTLGESLLLQQELPPSVTTIVQVVALWQLERTSPFEPDHLTMLKMCGWRASPATREAIGRAFGSDTAEELDYRPLHDAFAARTHVRAAIEATARDLLRRGEPGGWRPEQLVMNLDGPPQPRFELNRSQQLVLAEAAATARRHGRRYIVVLIPLHPKMRKVRGPAVSAFRSAVREVVPDVVDLTELLSAEEFRDATHASGNGARKITARVAEALR